MPDVAGGGHVMVSLESTHGTYEAPTITVPIESETLTEMRNDPTRNPILGRAVNHGKVKGREHVEGEIVMEALPLQMVYFMAVSRWNQAKTGAGPYVYTFEDSAAAHIKGNDRSLSIGVARAGIGFAYLGCQVVGMRHFFEDGIFKVAYQIIGREQTNDFAALGTPATPSETPFAADEVAITLAAASRVDIDSMEMSFDDGGEARFNLDGNEAASYVLFGEHDGRASFEVDFESKADYDIWAARTAQEAIMTLTKGANQIVNLEIHGGLYDSFEVALGGIGDQVRASAEIMASYDETATQASTIIITTNTDVAEIT